MRCSAGSAAVFNLALSSYRGSTNANGRSSQSGITRTSAAWSGRLAGLEGGNLEAEIRKALTEVSSETLLIRGDKNVYLGAAVDIMSTAKKAGASHIAILTAPTK